MGDLRRPVPALAIVAVVVLYLGLDAKAAGSRKGDPPPAKTNTAATAEKKPAEAEKFTGPKRLDPNASFEEVYKWVEAAVVKITVTDGGSLGTGYVVDPSGIVATNHHVMKACSKATATFNNGEKHEIEGYLAARPEWDAALVKLKTVPKDIHALELFEGPTPRR